MPQNGDRVPDNDHLLRYIAKKFVDRGTGKVDGSGFLARKGEDAPSANWIECFPAPKDNQIAQIRAVKCIRYEKHSKLVQIKVGNSIAHVATNAQFDLEFVHDALAETEKCPADPSHALMRGIPELETSEGFLVGDLLRQCIIDQFDPVPD